MRVLRFLILYSLLLLGFGCKPESSSPQLQFSFDFKLTSTVDITNNYALDLVSQDLDDDGDIDFIVAEATEEKITFFLNNGEGEFIKGDELIASGDTGSRILVRDFNNDDFFDIVVPTTTGDLNVWLNDGSNGFSFRDDYPLSASGVMYIADGDIDNDGYLDLVSADRAGSSISVYLNQGDGSFALHSTIAGCGEPFGIALFDMDQDGSVDLIYSSQADDTINVRYGQGDGTFGSAVSAPSSLSPDQDRPTDLGIGDFNGDRIPDIAFGVECTRASLTPSQYLEAFPLESYGSSDVYYNDAYREYSEDYPLDAGDTVSDNPESAKTYTKKFKGLYDRCRYPLFNSRVSIYFGSSSDPFADFKDVPTKAYGDSIQLKIFDVNGDLISDITSIDDKPFHQGAMFGLNSEVSVIMGDRSPSRMESQNIEVHGNYSNTLAFDDFNGDGFYDMVADFKGQGDNLAIFLAFPRTEYK